MSIADCTVPGTGTKFGAVGKRPTAKRLLHRLGTVRRQQGVSRRTVARRLNVDIGEVKSLEQETADMLLSTLYQWQELLQIPIAELLVEPDETLSPPVMKRAQMVRLMKTAAAILQRAQQPMIRRMAETMVDQLVDMMPELENVGPWHAVGRRRTLDEVGRAVERRISADMFTNHPDD